MSVKLELEKFIRETNERSKKIDEQFKKTDDFITRLSRDNKEIRTNWGKLVEALVEPSVLRLFHERDIDVQKTYTNVKVESKRVDIMEIDVMAINGDSIILIEVKTTLEVGDVKRHINHRLKNFLKYFPEYNDKKVYGAVAYIKTDGQADRFAIKNGLFALSLSGENMMVMRNEKDFKPKDYRAA